MISREDIQSLIEMKGLEHPVLSVFLDMSVNSDNKRTYQIFLNKERSRQDEIAGDLVSATRESVGRAFTRLQEWIDVEYDEGSKGVAVFLELDGEWVQGFQLPVPLENRAVVDERPVIGPLFQVMQGYHHHGVVLVDREHLRILSLFMDQALRELRVDTEPYPAPHDVKRGGYSQKDFQKRKEEETRHFFKEFAQQVEEFVRRYVPDDLILLGTDENVKKFREFLPNAIRDRVVHTAHAPVEATAPEVAQRLESFFRALAEQETTRAVDLLRDRVEHQHRATAGFHRTLEQLQEGKVEKLVLGKGVEKTGARCETCGFLLVRRDSGCPYCGGEVKNGIDLAEAMVRLAAEQEVSIDFVPAEAVADLDGVGALLRF